MGRGRARAGHGRMRRLLIGGCAVAALMGAACGGEGAGETKPADARGGADSSGSTVSISGLTFKPSSLEVEAGTTVEWVNEDDVAHTVTSGRQGEQAAPGVNEGKDPKPDGLFDYSLAGAGDAVTFTFDEAGTYPYYCDIHRQMVGEIIVG